MAVTDEMVCFAVHAAARATANAYRTLLEPWGLTYTQYLVLVVLWVEGDQTVSSLGERLQLDSGTLSPLLRRLETHGVVARERRDRDERVVTVTLTDRGRALRQELEDVPRRIAEGTGLQSQEQAQQLIGTLHHLNRSMREAGATPLSTNENENQKEN